MNILPSGSSYTFTLNAWEQLTVTSRGGTTVTGPNGLLGTVSGTSTFGGYSADTVITIAAVMNDCQYGVTEPENALAYTDANNNTVLVGADGVGVIKNNDTAAQLERWDAASGAYVGVGGLGEIALFGAADVVASAVFNASSLGTTLNWIGTGGPLGSVDGVIFDDTAGGVFDPASPARITIPVGSGITRANFTGGISIPAQSTGERWIRLVQGGTTHLSSAVFAATTTPSVQNIQLNTGWIDVTEGQYFELHLVQNSGVSITVAAGNYSNKGGSTFFRASFK